MDNTLDDNYKNYLIEELCKEHPGHGVNKGWSTYIGGMTDTGHWHRDIMEKATVTELNDRLLQIQAHSREERKRIKEYESLTEAEKWERYRQEMVKQEEARRSFLQKKNSALFLGKTVKGYYD